MANLVTKEAFMSNFSAIDTGGHVVEGNRTLANISLSPAETADGSVRDGTRMEGARHAALGRVYAQSKRLAQTQAGVERDEEEILYNTKLFSL
jgi:hypothetical protein